MYCFATYIQIQHAYGDFMQQESQIYESIISNILVAGDVDNSSPQKKSSEVWGTFGFLRKLQVMR